MGIESGSRVPTGPYASGAVPPHLLEVERFDCTRFTWHEIGRMIQVWWVVITTIVLEVVGNALRFGADRDDWGRVSARIVRVSFTRLGPTFIKFGQMIASAPGLFPAVLSDECQVLLNRMPTFGIDLVRETVRADLGVELDDFVASFDELPMSAASIAQVHACRLKDGRDAVLKVQRPSLHHDVNRDLRIQYRIARLLSRVDRLERMNPVAVVEDFNRTVHEELNFLLEADRQTRFRDNIGAFGDNKWVTAPEVYWDYCGERVLCMERLHGVALDEFDAFEERGIDGELILRRGVKVWMEAAYHHGLYHGDVHAGNLMLLDDGRAAYLDFGIMGEMPPEYREASRAMLETAMIDQDYTRIVRAFKQVGMLPEDIGPDEQVARTIRMFVQPMVEGTVSDLSLGEMIQNQMHLAEQFGTRTDPNMILTGKQLMYFERYVKRLAPNWRMTTDVYLAKNLFPEDVARKVEEDALVLPED